MDKSDVTVTSFRDAMASIASSVCVLTTSGPSGRYGITVSSLCSVTDTPPTLLACVNRKGIANHIFKTNKAICVNVLASVQENIGNHYARGQDYQQDFNEAVWNLPENLPPELKLASSVIQGQIASVVEYGTHSVFFIQIQDIKNNPDPTGLIYFKRKYVPLY